jgi:hypothetical protein
LLQVYDGLHGRRLLLLHDDKRDARLLLLLIF